MEHQLGLKVERQKMVEIVYKGNRLATNLRLDMVINGLVIVECKSVNQYSTIFEAQALTYLRVTGLKLALIINFGERLVKNGTKRVVNHLYA